MRGDLIGSAQLRLDNLGQLLSKLHTVLMGKRLRRVNSKSKINNKKKGANQHTIFPSSSSYLLYPTVQRQTNIFPSSCSCSHLPPLVKGVDVPDPALHKDLVLVHGCWTSWKGWAWKVALDSENNNNKKRKKKQRQQQYQTKNIFPCD